MLASDQNDIQFQPNAVLQSVTVGSPRFLDGYGQTVKLRKGDGNSSGGDYLFVAAPFSRPANATVLSGSIYVYKKDRGQWVLSQLIETNGQSDHLGALDIEAQGDWLMFSAVGTPVAPVASGDALNNQNFQGSLQIYRLNKKTGLYEFAQALDSSTPGLENLSNIAPVALNPSIPFFLNQQGGSFGMHFGLDAKKGVLLVGAEYQMNDNKINSGAVYAFDLNKKSKLWTLSQTITNPDGVASNDTFGYNVRVKNKVAIIGNGSFFQGPKFGPVAANSAVYVYNYDNSSKSWQYTGQKLVGDQMVLPLATTFSGSTMPMGDSFGASMDIDKNWAIIGAPLESNNSTYASYSGAAYFYKVEDDGSLVRTQKIYSDDQLSYMTGFIHIDLDGNTAVIADPGRTGNNGDYQGGALVYKLKQDQWTQVATLTDVNGGQYSFFGGAVSIDGNEIAVGGIPFAGFSLVAFKFVVAPPFHSSLLLPPTVLNPSIPIASSPVMVFGVQNDDQDKDKDDKN